MTQPAAISADSSPSALSDAFLEFASPICHFASMYLTLNSSPRVAPIADQPPSPIAIAVHLYLSLIPEALIYSLLPPKQFGKHLSIGRKRLSNGPAIFFEVDPDFESDVFNLPAARKRCVPHPDGSPRHSSYAAIYMVLANVPISALGKLYLVTADGMTLGLDRDPADPPERAGLHLYQEICPVQPRVASPLGPKAFARYVTDSKNPIFLPRIAFSDLRIGGLAIDPQGSAADDLPYRNLQHLRECLDILKHKSDKMTKIVTRDLDTSRLYPVMGNAFYVGDQRDFAHYPLPSADFRETKHRAWFNSAMTQRSR